MPKTDSWTWRSRRFAAALLCLGALGAQAADFKLPDLMKLLQQQKSGTASFVETRRLALIDKPLESSGELSFNAPDRLEKRTLKPHTESLILDGDKLSITQGDKRPYTVRLQQYPEVAALVDSIRGALAGDQQALEKNYTLELSGTADKWQLVLAPSQPALTKIVRRIRMAGHQAALQTIDIEQADGDSSAMVISRPATP
ncbi:LolA-related protein [Rhodoferax sp. GW822-FHT02A01]|uniref:LolA-related protein n=1 Tax=Rhodoferax sp. GW822-FHT02A01 TaxID=3141537 RepID=UPI00315DB3B2